MVLGTLNIQRENHTKDAAIHFGAYLQKSGLLKGDSREYGTIEQGELVDQFKNHYQPKYHSVLVLPELLNTLRQYRIIAKNRKKNKQTSHIRINKHPNAEGVAEPRSVVRKLVFVDQTRVLRGRLQHEDAHDESQCRLCNVQLPDEQAKVDHLDSDIHKFKLQYRQNRSKFVSSIDTTGGNKATISLLDLEDDTDIVLREGMRRNVTVKVSLSEHYEKADIFKIIDLNNVDANPTQFSNNMDISVSVSALFSDPGAYIYPLVAKIMPNHIVLLKDLIFRVQSEIVDQLKPVSPYQQQKSGVVVEMSGATIPGEELPKSSSKLQTKVPLGNHKIPVVYNKLFIHKFQRFDGMNEHEDNMLGKILGLLCGLKSYQEAMQQVRASNAPFIEPLDASTYSERFSVLVDLEELQEQSQIRQYDRKDETLTQQGTKFFLQVPDLSEGRPSVTRGDKVNIRLKTGQQDGTIYEGVIHEIRGEGLLLGFHREFSEKYRGAGGNPKVDVCFTVSRFCNLNMHRALSIMQKDQAFNLVFPQATDKCSPPAKKKKLKEWQNPLIESNPQQQKAIQNIVTKTSGYAPYLVFGPPGTGKTVTLVETIAQVWLSNELIPPKQLVCAPSNAACNNIAERLISTLPKAKILRLYSFSTEGTQIPDALLKYSNWDSKYNSVYMPTIEEILSNEIIVVTIVSSGRLVTGGARDVFKYVYIDECGQASEPEALIAIAGILTSAKSQGQLVLAGDPEQLGPILASPPAKDFGLGMSLLERLMKHNSLYKKQEDSGYNNDYLTKLVQNFRSHPAILKLSNQLFYDNELEVKGNPDIINKAVGWQELPNKQFPLIFHGVQGIDERESNSPSYFNRQEIDIVIRYIEKLKRSGLPNNYKVSENDIGVITPYRKQAQKFRRAFDIKGWGEIRVGSVEEFQGSEKLIVFISTVRSNFALVDEDYRYRLGFLKNPKRFNVSITRAQALLIVVGNPNILRHDKHWYQLLTYCRNNNAAVGIRFPEEDPPEHAAEHVST